MRARGFVLAWVVAVAACGGEAETATAGATAAGAASESPDAAERSLPRARSADEPEKSDAAKPTRTPAEWARILRDESSSDEQREAAMNALVELGADAVPFLVDALNDEVAADWVLDGLCRLGPSGVAAAPALLDRIRHGKVRSDLAALIAFGPAAIPAMEKALTDSEEGVRHCAASVLAQLAARKEKELDASDAARLSEILGRLTNDTDPSMRGFGLFGLSYVWNARSDTTTVLVSGLSDEAWWVRCCAASYLRRCPGDVTAIVPALVRALDDPHTSVGISAANSLRALGDRAGNARVAVLEFVRKHPEFESFGVTEVGIDPLQTALASGDPEIRRLAAQTLAGMGSQAGGAAPSLVKAIDDPVPGVRESALDALAAAGAPADAAPKIRGAFTASEPKVRAAAARALGRLPAASEDVVSDLLKGLTDPVGDVRAESAIALGRLASDAARSVPALAVALDDADLRTRASAAYALGAFGAAARDAASDLRRSLAHPDPWVRMGAAWSLARIEPNAPEPWPAFEKLAIDSNSDVRRRAVVTVGELRREEGVPVLTGRLEDRDRNVRLAAANALRGLGADAADAIPALESMEKSRDVQIASAAREAIAAIRAK